MKKLLITLLSVLMIVSIGVANVAAEEDAVKQATTTATIRVLFSDKGLDNLGTTAKGCYEVTDEVDVPLKVQVPLHYVIDGVTEPYYYLDDVMGAVNEYAEAHGTRFLMFANHYYDATKTATKWVLKGIESQREYRYAAEISECFAVFAGESVNDKGFVIDRNLVYNGKEQSPFVDGTPSIDGATILYKKAGDLTWSSKVPTYKDAGEYTFVRRVQLENKPWIGYEKIEKVEIKKFTLSNENTKIDFFGPDKNGEKVKYFVSVCLDGENYVPLWFSNYTVNNTDLPKNFGINNLTVIGQGKNYNGSASAEYNVGTVADQYVEWNGNEKYSFDAKYNPVTNTYVAKTSEGYNATAVAVNIKDKVVLIAGRTIDALFGSHRVRLNPNPEVTFKYEFILGNVGSLIDRIEYGKNLPICTANLHVFNKDLETGEVDSVNGDFVYYDDENSTVDGKGKYVSVVVPLGKDYENVGIDEQMKKHGLAKTSSYDIYVLFFADGAKEGVRVEPAKGNKVTVTLDNPYADLGKVAAKHVRNFVAVHEKAEGNYELLNVTVDGDKAKVTADSFSVFSFGYKDVKVPSEKKDRKYEPVETGIVD